MSQDKAVSTIEELNKVWTPEANWNIPKAKAVFKLPAFGPENYNDVVKQVLASGQKLPTGEETAFMLDEAYNSPNNDRIKTSPRIESVRNIILNNWFLVPVVNIWTPNSIKNPGMYTLFDANGEGITREVTTDELEDRLSGGSTERGVRFSNDRYVAFAPRNTFKEGYHEKGTLKDDGAFIAVYGPDGAEKLDRVDHNFIGKPYSWIVSNTSEKLVKTLSALGGAGALVGRLAAYFSSSGNDVGGCVLSVSGSENGAEGTAPKK